ncbi:MAG: sensor histidine kinase [Oscillospiraceae bacterium]|jgi:signal transduction histidine kinase|nr:sensor histidine kinase [Oscillospiraceae bacterium]
MKEQILWILEQLQQPAFLAENGVVAWRNTAAQGAVSVGTTVKALLGENMALFSMWQREETLLLPLAIGGEQMQVSVRAVQEADLFIAAPRARKHDSTADALINASISLRKPLHTMAAAARELFDVVGDREDPVARRAATQMNRNLYQLMRLCGQLSDGGKLLQRSYVLQREQTQLRAFFDDLVLQLRPLLGDAGFDLRYTGLSAEVTAGIDRQLIERAVYNLLSNAMKYSRRGEAIALVVAQHGRLLVVRVSDTGEGVSPKVMAQVFERYSDIGVGDPRWGIGLGLTIVHEIAQLHGGTAMVSCEEGGGTSAMFSVSLDNKPEKLRSATMHYDAWGGYHHGLIELSDVLPSELLDPQDIL